jgi:sterol desaturase/sphingolipid hydroxylase (fatty acid hydroxylase superfamily)
MARKVFGDAQISSLAPYFSKRGIDKNFAIHFPWIDKIFGSYYYPDEWPERYGLDGEEIARGFFGQTIEPFTKRKRTS